MSRIAATVFLLCFLININYAYAQDFVFQPDSQNQIRVKASPRKGEVNAGAGYGQTSVARWFHTWVQGSYYLIDGKHRLALTATASVYGGRSDSFEFGGEKFLFGPTYQGSFSRNHILTARLQYGVRMDRGRSANYFSNELTHVIAPFVAYQYARKSKWLPGFTLYSLAEIGINKRKNHYIVGTALEVCNLGNGIFRPGIGVEGGFFHQEDGRYDVTPIVKMNLFWGILYVDYRYGVLSRAHSVNIGVDVYEFFRRVL